MKVKISFDVLDLIIAAMWGEIGQLEKKVKRSIKLNREDLRKSFADRAAELDIVADKLNEIWLSWVADEITEAEIEIIGGGSTEHIT